MINDLRKGNIHWMARHSEELPDPHTKSNPKCMVTPFTKQIFSVLIWVSGLLLKYLTTRLPAEGFFSISTKEMLFTSIYFTLRQILAAHLSENFTLNTLAQFPGSWIKCRSGELTGYYCPGNSSKAGVRMSCTKDVQHKQYIQSNDDNVIRDEWSREPVKSGLFSIDFRY